MNMQYAQMVFAHEKAHRERVDARHLTADDHSMPAPAAAVAAGVVVTG